MKFLGHFYKTSSVTFRPIFYIKEFVWVTLKLGYSIYENLWKLHQHIKFISSVGP